MINSTESHKQTIIASTAAIIRSAQQLEKIAQGDLEVSTDAHVRNAEAQTMLHDLMINGMLKSYERAFIRAAIILLENTL